MESIKPVQSTSSCNNTTIENFDWDAFEQSEQGKQAKEQNKLDNLKDEITYYKNLIQKKQRDIRRAERSIARAEKELKEVQEAERARKIKELLEVEKARKIKELLEANKGKRVVIEWEVDYNLFSDEADNIYFYTDGNNDKHICLSGIGQSIPVCLIEKIYVEAEI